MSDEITVRLTRPQAEALIALVSYAGAGGPEDVGFNDDLEGHRQMRSVDTAGDRIAKALWRDKPRSKR